MNDMFEVTKEEKSELSNVFSEVVSGYYNKKIPLELAVRLLRATYKSIWMARPEEGRLCITHR